MPVGIPGGIGPYDGSKRPRQEPLIVSWVRTQTCPLFFHRVIVPPMVQEPKQGELFPEVHAPPGATVINARCMVRTRDAHRVVIVAGVVIAPYALGDRMAEAYRR